MSDPHAHDLVSRRRALTRLGAAAGCGALGAWGGGVVMAWGDVPSSSASQPQLQAESARAGPKPRVTTIASGLTNPWGLVVLPDGRALPAIWSLGHRNVQGAAIHPGTGELWTCEHGPQGGDEVNIDRAGRNFGWPRISFGCAYGAPVGDCTPVGGASAAPGLEPPLATWVPTSIAPSGMAFYTGSMFPQWRGSLFIGALAGRALWRLSLDGNRVVAREALFRELGERIRDVRQAPDGSILLVTDSSNGRILRLRA